MAILGRGGFGELVSEQICCPLRSLRNVFRWGKHREVSTEKRREGACDEIVTVSFVAKAQQTISARLVISGASTWPL